MENPHQWMKLGLPPFQESSICQIKLIYHGSQDSVLRIVQATLTRGCSQQRSTYILCVFCIPMCPMYGIVNYVYPKQMKKHDH